jgi:hypothetical protein
MGPARYFVFQHHGHWLVTLDGAKIAAHPTRPEALSSAIVMADLMGAMRYDADVMVEDPDGLNIAWTFGTDPVPAPRQAP